MKSLPASRTGHAGSSGLTPRQTNDGQAYPSSLTLYLALSFAEAPPVHSTSILSGLTVTLTVETAYASNIFQNYRFSPLDCYRNNRLCSSVQQMTGPSGGSSLSIFRRYRCSYPSIVSSERSQCPHCIFGYSQSPIGHSYWSARLSNCKITKITVDADCGSTLYTRSVPGDTDAELICGESEGAHLDVFLRNNCYSMLVKE